MVNAVTEDQVLAAAFAAQISANGCRLAGWTAGGIARRVRVLFQAPASYSDVAPILAVLATAGRIVRVVSGPGMPVYRLVDVAVARGCAAEVASG
jgi:hypothetical protein